MARKCLQMNYSTCSLAEDSAVVDSTVPHKTPGSVLTKGGFGPGVRVHTFGGPRHQRRQQQHANAQPQGNTSIFYQLLPILILLLVTILPAIFSSPSTPTPLPSFVLETASPPYTHQRLTPQHSIPYFVNPSEISTLPKSRLRQLDNQAEVTFLRGLQHQCQGEYNVRQQKLADAQGWFGQITDQTAWDEARTMRMGSCERLRKMGYRPDVY
jgi:DnaJ homolog subfamily B member 12